MKFIKLPIAMLAFLFAFALAPQVVLAEDSEDEVTTSESEKKAQEQAREAAKKLEENRQEAAKKRAEAAKKQQEEATEVEKQQQEQFKKACENRRENYKNRLEGIAERSQRHIEVLEKIVERVKAFKDTKNLDVANYDALVAEIAAKKLVVHDLQEEAKQLAETEFNCERDAAQESVDLFKDVLHQQIDALKEYKTAVKNLIVAVKTAVESTEQGDDSNEDQE